MSYDYESETAKLTAWAKALGIDIDEHRCTCEACSRTSELCPASLSSIESAIRERVMAKVECDDCEGFGFVDDGGGWELCDSCDGSGRVDP